MSTESPENERGPRPSTLPGDDLRRIMWRFGERQDLQELIPARLLAAIEPILRHRRSRAPELREDDDVVHRLVDVWATGEAGAALGFAAARLADELEAPAKDESQSALADVVRPACTLWNLGPGAGMMREAGRLMGGEAGRLVGGGAKGMDAELEAVPPELEAAERRQLATAMTDELFLARLQAWIRELRQIAGRRPGTGACNLASAVELWLWTLRYLMGAKDAGGKELFGEARQAVRFAMADALSWLVASRYQMLDLVELADKEPADPELAGFVALFSDLCRVQMARAAGKVGRIGAELVFGYHRHPSWDADGDACYRTEHLEALEGIIPGIGGHAVAIGDVIEADGSHPPKAGPCVRFVGMETFCRMRTKLDGCLTGAYLAKERVARALAEMTIPEAPPP